MQNNPKPLWLRKYMRWVYRVSDVLAMAFIASLLLAAAWLALVWNYIEDMRP